MTPQSPSSRVHARRVRRSTVLVVSALTIAGLPLVAHALESDAAEAVTTTAAATAAPAVSESTIPPSTVTEPNRRTAWIVPELGATPDAAAAPDAAPTATPTPEEQALEAAIIVVTDSYEWDERSPRVEALQRTLGVVADGWYGHATHQAHRVALVAAGFPTDALPVPVLPPGPSADQWEALRQCESGGDYSITNPSGKYRGAYQFDRPTWNSVAGRHVPHLVGVDPAAASRADQDAMAFALYGERSHRPWPQCGRHLR